MTFFITHEQRMTLCDQRLFRPKHESFPFEMTKLLAIQFKHLFRLRFFFLLPAILFSMSCGSMFSGTLDLAPNHFSHSVYFHYYQSIVYGMRVLSSISPQTKSNQNPDRLSA